MCGITGSIHTKLNLHQALAKIKHRGPDADGLFENELIQFGHVRLSIIDLTDGANQPFENAVNGSVLVFNGEIYNYKELRKELESGHQFQTQSDTEVLFVGLQRYGIDYVHKLQGMFAFAFYDGIKKESFLARDRFGIKPLYIKKDGEGFVFGSEIKAILNSDFTLDSINQKLLSDFIYHRRLDHTNQTFYNGIEQLPAGSYLSYDHNTLQYSIFKYYEVPCYGKGNKEFYPEELNSKIVETVQSHLQADVPIGSFLSGGIDSSIISHVMSRLTPEVATLSGRTVYEHEENKLIDTYLKEHPNTNSIQFTLDGTHFYEEIFNVIAHHDEPILDGSMFSHYMLCKKAKENGLKVVLSGSGGDEVFGGYESHSMGFLSDQVANFQLKEFRQKLAKYAGFHRQNSKNILPKIAAELTGQRIKNRIKNLKKNSEVLTLEKQNEFFQTTCSNHTGRAFERSLKYQTVPPYLHYEDRNSMAFGVEIRVPFLDHKLVEYVAAVKREALFDGTTKTTLRQAFKNEMPTAILFQRKKEGFPSPIDTALRADENLKAFFKHRLEATPFLNVQNCRKLADEFYATGKNLTLYWRILSYMIWFDINIKQIDQ
ncbi:MAG: asparagine synthase (glutamine-hydrolyzing) [Bacteroidota bacterium]